MNQSENIIDNCVVYVHIIAGEIRTDRHSAAQSRIVYAILEIQPTIPRTHGKLPDDLPRNTQMCVRTFIVDVFVGQRARQSKRLVRILSAHAQSLRESVVYLQLTFGTFRKPP